LAVIFIGERIIKSFILDCYNAGGGGDNWEGGAHFQAACCIPAVGNVFSYVQYFTSIISNFFDKTSFVLEKNYLFCLFETFKIIIKIIRYNTWNFL